MNLIMKYYMKQLKQYKVTNPLIGYSWKYKSQSWDRFVEISSLEKMHIGTFMALHGIIRS